MNDFQDKQAARQKAYRAANVEKMRDYDRSRDRAGYIRPPAKSKRKPFVGIDGEGRNLPNGYHAYFMLRSGNELLTCAPGNVRIRSLDSFEFVSNLATDAIHVGYFFDYDSAKILEDLPFARLEYLMDREKRTKKRGGFWPVAYAGYEVDYMPHKELKIRKEGGEWVTINDVGTFFQCSFIDAITLWDIGTPEQRAQIAEGKELRADFANITDEYIDAYNSLECVLLAQLMEKFRDACEEVGYVPKKWQGPGLLAEAILDKHGIPRTDQLSIFAVDSDIVDSPGGYGRMAYYGGRFETSIVGFSPVSVRQYDINSAYPAALLQAPCLEHGTWEKVTGKRTITPDETSICFGTFRWPRRGSNPHFMGFPVRTKDGSIRFPFDGKGWYWSHEIRAAKHQTFTVLDSWVYHRTCECVPFDFIRDIYAERKRLGKNAKGMVLKLALNSLYGKMAQSVGSPKYANPIWASFITSWCRATIQDAIHAAPACNTPGLPCGSDIYMIATDSVTCKNDIPLPIGDQLGEWSRDVHEDGLFIIQPGVYFDVGGKEVMYKTRGVPKRKIIAHRDEFIDAFHKMKETRRVTDGDVLIPMTLFIGVRQALHRHSLKLLGQLVEYKDPITGDLGRRTSFEWGTKRRPQPFPIPANVNYILTAPYLGTVGEHPDGAPVQTFPYSKDIGGLVARQMRQLDFEDQPDWIPGL